MYLLNFLFGAEENGFRRVLGTTFLLLAVQVVLFIAQTQLIAAPYAYSFLVFGASLDKQILALVLTILALTSQFFLHKLLVRLPVGQTIISILILFIVSQVPAWSASHSLIRLVTVTDSNMTPTLNPGDCILVKLNSSLQYTPQPSDLIVYADRRSYDSSEQWKISRVVGLPGDQLSIRDGRIFINDRLAGVSSSAIKTSHGKSFSIPDGVCYYLGDNPDLSIDSRQLGFLPMNEIKGYVEMIVFPSFPRMLTFNSLFSKPDDRSQILKELP